MLGFCPQEHKGNRKQKRFGTKEIWVQILVVVSLLALDDPREHYSLVFQIGTIVISISQDCAGIKII